MFSEYIKAGWALCALEKGKKGPTYDNWPNLPIDAEVADTLAGAGLLHVQSKTCAIDIDHIDIARPWLAERGVDLDSLLSDPKAVRIDSGRPGRAKLLYRLKTPLRTVKPKGSGVELRCASAEGSSLQDVLPPSIHPDTRKPYQWAYGEPLLGDWALLPPLPASLLHAWRQLLAEMPADVPRERVNGSVDRALERLDQWIKTQDPNMGYNEWVKVGMKLHDATHGAEEGLEIWKDWSSKATRKAKTGGRLYTGDATCRVHWVSFSSTPGKHVARVDAELPADSSEFEVLPDKPAVNGHDTEAALRETSRQQKQKAMETLEHRLVYVLSSEKYFDTVRHKLISTDSAIEHQFTSMMPRVKGVRLNPVKLLKQSTTKRFVEGLGFHPGEGEIFKAGGDTFANMYRNRLPDPLEPTLLELEKIEWLFNRIDDPTYVKWLKQYYAHVVQRPAVKLRSAPLIWSETQRNGKSTLVKTIPMLLVGAEFSSEASFDVLSGTFNDYVIGAWHVHLTEFRAASRGERSLIINKLKAYIADDMITAHPKGGRSYTMPNHFFVTASSNEEDAAAIDNNDERWGVHELKVPKYTPSEVQWIYPEFLLTSRAAAVLRHYFLNISLEGFNPTASAPMTESKQEMVSASVPADVEFLISQFEARAGCFNRDVVLTDDVMDLVHQRFRYLSPTKVGRIMAKPPFNGIAKKLRVGQAFYRCIIVRNHKTWSIRPHRDVYDYIQGADDDIDANVDLMA